MSYIVEPLLVDRTFGKWLLSRKFVDKGLCHTQMSKDNQMLLSLTCSKSSEISFSLHVGPSLVVQVDQIAVQVIELIKFSKGDMLETAQVFIPEMRRIVFNSIHPVFRWPYMKSIPSPIDGTKIIPNDSCFLVIFL